MLYVFGERVLERPGPYCDFTMERANLESQTHLHLDAANRRLNTLFTADLERAFLKSCQGAPRDTGMKNRI